MTLLLPTHQQYTKRLLPHTVLTCPAGQTYKCGPPVPPSCDNPTGVDGVCVDGCFCNDGTILNANGQCVTEDQCGGM